jgi:hypothetical protein
MVNAKQLPEDSDASIRLRTKRWYPKIVVSQWLFLTRDLCWKVSYHNRYFNIMADWQTKTRLRKYVVLWRIHVSAHVLGMRKWDLD